MRGGRHRIRRRVLPLHLRRLGLFRCPLPDQVVTCLLRFELKRTVEIRQFFSFARDQAVVLSLVAAGFIAIIEFVI